MTAKLDEYQQQVNGLFDGEKAIIHVSTVTEAEASLEHIEELKLSLQKIQKRIELDIADMQVKSKQPNVMMISKSLKTKQTYPLLGENFYTLEAYNSLKNKIDLSIEQINNTEKDLAKLIHFPRYIAQLSIIFGGQGQIVLGQRKKG
jgi:hypothetical protein